MRVDSNGSVGQTVETGVSGQPRVRTVGEAGTAAAEADKAELSNDPARVETLSQTVLQLPEVRQEKVQALAAQVQNGSYQVAPQQTAEALLSELTRAA